jgi:flagellar basal-body rod protein FlgF
LALPFIENVPKGTLMESPLLLALSRQLAVRDQMEAIANNVANMSTPAYKGERTLFHEYLSGQKGARDKEIIYPQLKGLFRETKEGQISVTGNSLDVALRGKGYLVVETPDGPRYTRDGHLSLNAKNQIVTQQGLPVLGLNNRPMSVPQDAPSITIAEDGSISAGDVKVGQFKLVSFENEQHLVRTGDGLYRTDALPNRATDVDVLQGSLEGANVQPVLEITRMIEAARIYESAQKIVNSEDERIRKAIDRLAKVA